MGMSLSRSTIRLMLQSQRMIKQEFGIHIHLNDKQAVGKFLAYAGQSNSKDLINTVTKLQNEMTPVNDELVAPKKEDKTAYNVRYYRGQRIEEPVAQPNTSDTDTQSSGNSKAAKEIIYRGQRVAV